MAEKLFDIEIEEDDEISEETLAELTNGKGEDDE